MIIEPITLHDIDLFLAWAGQEGWIAERREMEFLLAAFPAGCLISRDDAGCITGFITALPHTRSGWIGNLLVASERRGLGIGRALFREALAALTASAVAAVWLTASMMGIGLYEQHSFQRIDTIERWTGTGKGASNQDQFKAPGATEIEKAMKLDAMAWGDVRQTLLAEVMEPGQVLFNDNGFVVVRSFDNRSLIGPFAAQDKESAAGLLAAALTLLPEGVPVYLDVPAANRSARHILHQAGLRVCGENELMCRGEKPEHRSHFIFGLATMGSCG